MWRQAMVVLLLAGCQAPAWAPAEEPSFELVSARVFSTCTTRSCHGTLGRRGDLVLTPEAAYAALVSVPAANEAARSRGKLRVVPGLPEESFLYQKLTAPEADEGARMPLVGPPLAAEELALVRAWIAAGAPPPREP